MTEKENTAVQKSSLCYSINMLRLLLSMQLITFDEDLFEQIVESITVISGQKLSFRLAGGLVLTEKI